MKTTPIDQVLRKHYSDKEIADAHKWATKEAQRMALRELRKSLGITQKQLSRSLKVSQPVISDMENRADYQLTTLRRVVHALGGELDIIARFPGRVVALHVA